MRPFFAPILVAGCVVSAPSPQLPEAERAPVARRYDVCRVGAWTEQLGDARIVAASGARIGEELVLSDGSVRAFDGFGSVHRERWRCDTGLAIRHGTRHVDDRGSFWELATTNGELWRLESPRCRLTELGRAPPGTRKHRQCRDGTLLALTEDEFRLYDRNGELVDSSPAPTNDDLSMFPANACVLCHGGQCLVSREGRLHGTGGITICGCGMESTRWDGDRPSPCLEGAESIPLDADCRLLWNEETHAVSCTPPRVHGVPLRRPWPDSRC